jgi:hypothetical protein
MRARAGEADSLLCPTCATTYPFSERFCPRCRMPLTYAPGHAAAAAPLSERHERARKIKPQYGEGALVKVARASSQVEAEFIQGLLLEEGVPSLLRRAPGFDVPDFLAAGPRDVLVPQSGLDVARDVLLIAAPPVPPPAAADREVPPRLRAAWRVRWLAALLAAVIVVGFAIAVIAALH